MIDSNYKSADSEVRSRMEGSVQRAHEQTRAVISIAIFLLACFSCAFGLDPSLDIGQYAHTSWKVREGFTRGAINAIAQTPDGYLWLGTDFGLLRFDGVRTTPWEPPGNEHLPSKVIRRLFVSRDGTLWIGTHKGLVSWKGGKLTQYPQVPGQRIDALLEDREGTVWTAVAALPNWRLCAIHNGGVQCYGEEGGFGLGVVSLLEDRNGNLWAGTGAGLWRRKPGNPKRISLSGSASEIHGLIEGDNGALLITTRAGIVQLVDGKVVPYAVPDTGPQFNPFWLLRDRSGGLWVGTKDRGLLHVHQGRADHFAQADGLSSDFIEGLFEDREGNVWVATASGLDRFRDFAVSTISLNQGLSSSGVESVLAARDGSVWLGTRNGLDRRNSGLLTLYRKRSQVSGTVREIIDSGLPNDFQSSLYQDHLGRIWVFSADGASYLERDRFIPVRAMPGGYALAIAEDTAGDLWISQDQGLLHLFRRGAVEQIPWDKLGRQGVASALVADPSQGGIWLGFTQGGVEYFQDGQVRASYAAPDGLGEGRVNGLRFGSRATLWAATEGGLSRIMNGNIATLTSKNGLPCDAVHWSIEDDDHAVWMYMPCGLVRVVQTELDAWVTNSKRIIQATEFDNSDGLSMIAFHRGLTPAVGKSNDGKIWFLSGDGVSVIDPRHLPFNKITPPVYIEQIVADGKTYDASKGLRLPPRTRDLSIDYTALSLVAPEKVRFRFKLEGQDGDWRKVVNDRRVQYSNLAPGNYRFHVSACNNSGVWNEEGATLDFSIAPAYYQTSWFRALCMAMALALAWSLHRLRIRQLRRQEKKLREVIETIPTFAWTALPDGSVDFTNRNWMEYTGLPNEKKVGTGWEAAVHPEDLKRTVPKWRAAAASGEAFENEVRFRRADGEYRWFLVRAVPLRDGKGEIVKWYGTSTDIEDRKRAEQLQSDIAHINRVSMMGELAASISHELKQPITATITNAETSLRWLKREQPDLDEVRDAAERIVQDGSRATDIIDRLRSLYKNSPPQRELVDANQIAREMVVLLRGEANRYGVSIRIDLAADLPKITADRVQLQQVLMNLMLNAIEAMKETGGVLTVKSEVDPQGRVRISVTDTGVGLPPEKSDEIFNAFFTTKEQGSGMGLAISRSIVESHGGRLWATANEGRGATFHFNLPTTAETKVAAPEGDERNRADKR